MKISDLDRDDYWRIRDDLVETQKRLTAEFMDGGNNAQKFLLFTNAGAAIALIGFMGNSSEVRQAPLAWLALGCFLIGLVCVGLLHGVGYHLSKGVLMRYAKDAHEFRASEIDFEEFDRRRLAEKQHRWTSAFGWLAFLTFISGSAIAIGGLLPADAGAARVSESAPAQLQSPAPLALDEQPKPQPVPPAFDGARLAPSQDPKPPTP